MLRAALCRLRLSVRIRRTSLQDPQRLSFRHNNWSLAIYQLCRGQVMRLWCTRWMPAREMIANSFFLQKVNELSPSGDYGEAAFIPFHLSSSIDWDEGFILRTILAISRHFQSRVVFGKCSWAGEWDRESAAEWQWADHKWGQRVIGPQMSILRLEIENIYLAMANGLTANPLRWSTSTVAILQVIKRLIHWFIGKIRAFTIRSGTTYSKQQYRHDMPISTEN